PGPEWARRPKRERPGRARGPRAPERRFAHNPTLPTPISQLPAWLSHSSVSVFVLPTATMDTILPIGRRNDACQRHQHRAARRRGRREEGRVEEIQENIATSLEVRFGAPGRKLASRIRKINDLPELPRVVQDHPQGRHPG